MPSALTRHSASTASFIEFAQVSTKAPLSCPHCGWPMEFGAYLVDGETYCSACWLEQQDHPGETNEQWALFAARHRYVKPEHRAYPNRGERQDMPRNREGWIAYYNQERANPDG